MAIADCVHILVTQLHYMRIGYEKKKAIQESLKANFQPVIFDQHHHCNWFFKHEF